MRRSIQEMFEKINTYLDESFSLADIISIVLTVAIASSGLIYLTISDINVRAPLVYSESLGDVSAESSARNTGGSIIASSKGKTYFYAWCKNNISAKNKISFANEEEAKASGRTLSKTCK